MHEPTCFERSVALSVKLDSHARVGAQDAPPRNAIRGHVSRDLSCAPSFRRVSKKKRSFGVHTRGVCSICVFSLQVGLKRIAIWKENTEIEPEGRVDYMYSARAHSRAVESWSADKNACHVNPPGSVLNLSDGSSGSSVRFSCVARQSTYAVDAVADRVGRAHETR